jgi:very-short-patch-repair endonuclease
MKRLDKLKEELFERNAERPESHLEKWVKRFLIEWGFYDYIPEHQVDFYFIDVAFVNQKIALELDGKEFHKDKERDNKKDDYLKNKGWQVIRIPSNECWNPRILARHLFDLGRLLYGDYWRPSWGLAEVLGIEDMMVLRRPVRYWCESCQEVISESQFDKHIEHSPPPTLI